MVSLVLYGFLGETRTEIITCLSFLGLSARGNLGTSTITHALFKASTSAISYVASLAVTTPMSMASMGANIVLFHNYFSVSGSCSNNEFAFRVSNKSRFMYT